MMISHQQRCVLPPAVEANDEKGTNTCALFHGRGKNYENCKSMRILGGRGKNDKSLTRCVLRPAVEANDEKCTNPYAFFRSQGKR